jgi:hypothetical protein
MPRPLDNVVWARLSSTSVFSALLAVAGSAFLDSPSRVGDANYQVYDRFGFPGRCESKQE